MRLTSDHKLLLPQEEVAMKEETAKERAAKAERARAVQITKPPAPESHTRAGHANNKV